MPRPRKPPVREPRTAPPIVAVAIVLLAGLIAVIVSPAGGLVMVGLVRAVVPIVKALASTANQTGSLE
jgi:hypothetical protein